MKKELFDAYGYAAEQGTHPISNEALTLVARFNTLGSAPPPSDVQGARGGGTERTGAPGRRGGLGIHRAVSCGKPR